MKKSFIVLLIVLLLITFIFAIINVVAMHKTELAVIEETSNGVDTDIDIVTKMIQFMVDTDENWEVYDYDSIVKSIVDELDGKYMIYAAAYRDLGDGLILISDREASDVDYAFDPFAYDEFRYYIEENKSNMTVTEVELLWDPGNMPKTIMYTKFKWVPIGDNYDNPYLIIEGFSKYSVETNIPIILYFSIFGQLIIMGILVIAILNKQLKINRVRSEYSNRYGVDYDNK